MIHLGEIPLLKTWLFSIAHNITVDYIRKPLTILQDVLLFKKDLKSLPEEIVEIKESSQIIYLTQ
jgi:RNA polymerase sigma-70 factor, ECF subfamily